MKFNRNSQKKNVIDLIEKIFKIKHCISVNIVGSFTENINLNEIGDLDIVIISKKISKNFVDKCKLEIKKHNFPIKKKIKINDTFGPLKYDKKKNLIIHLMIYDVVGHINHVIKSPFTCYDWERNNFYFGKKLKDIYPVNKLQLRDFFNTRRAISRHFLDIKKGVISTYKYKFNKKNYKFIYKEVKLNSLNKRNYCKHIVRNNLYNFCKFYFQKNFKISPKDLNKLKIHSDFTKYFNLDYKNKNIIFVVQSTKKFLYKFYELLKNIKKNSNKIIFLRHAKTKFNYKNFFLGRKKNTGIIDYNNKDLEIYDKIYSSPLKRSIQTAKKFKTKKMEINNNLNEIDYGQSEGLNYNQLKIKYPKIIKNWSLLKDPRFPKGENLFDVSKRVFKFLKKLNNDLEFKNKQKYLVVTHNIFLKCLLGISLGIEKKDWFKLNIKHLAKLEFVKIDNKIVPNLNRKEILQIIKYKIDENSSFN